MKKFFTLFLIFAAVTISSLHALLPEEVPINTRKENRTDKRKGTVAICTMFRDEAPYLKEWIEYHQLVGVKHFYLYNNCSSDNYWEVLQPYVKKGIVELFEVPLDSTLLTPIVKAHNVMQIRCYNHAIGLAKGVNEWLAIIDSDEFICPVSAKDLPSLLKKYDDAPALVVYWQIYGTSNVWDLSPNDLMLEKLVYKAPENDKANFLFKSIVKPMYASCHNPHSCHYKDKRHPVTEDHNRFSNTPLYTTPLIKKIRINHYTYRTESYYYSIKKPRRWNWGFKPDPELEKQILQNANSVFDPIMQRFTPKLRKRMFE